jgi:hypothetical protein
MILRKQKIAKLSLNQARAADLGVAVKPTEWFCATPKSYKIGHRLIQPCYRKTFNEITLTFTATGRSLIVIVMLSGVGISSQGYRSLCHQTDGWL